MSSEIQSNYDIILIDIGPRLTIGALNAIIASTHLVVPAVLDQLSAETVGYFLNDARIIRETFNPKLRLAGVVGTMTYRERLSPRELDALATVREGLESWGGEGHIFARNIPRRQAIADLAGNDLAYLRNRPVQRLFDELGDELWKRLGYED